VSEGVHGETNAVRWVGAVTGVALNPDGNCPGVWGQSNGYGPGVFGQSNKDAGVTGFHGDPRLQENPVAASEGGRAGVFGASDVGAGVLGYSASNASAAVVAYGGLRASALTYPFAGEFFGNVVVNGDIFLPDADCAEHFEIAGCAPMAKKHKYVIKSSMLGADFGGIGCAPNNNLLNPNVTSDPPPGITFSGSGGLTNAHVQLVFWGSWWNGNPLAGQVTDAVTNLLAGPYMTYLAQYGIRRARLRGVTFVNDSEPGTFSAKNVSDFLSNTIDDGRLPEPDDDSSLYAVIMPANSNFQGGGAKGANGSYPAYFCWVGNDGSLDFITTVFSHELVELVTDPSEGGGVRQVGCKGNECQIGDPDPSCHNWCDKVRGVNAQAYWSQLDGNAALPKMYSIRRTLAGRSIGGKIPNPTPSVNAWITAQF